MDQDGSERETFITRANRLFRATTHLSLIHI